MPLEGCPPARAAPSVAGRLLERSQGKDTTVGHWELAGVVTERPFPTYPDGFPQRSARRVLRGHGPRRASATSPASGTEIIERLGEEHQRTGKWIVYTSADSVFQIAAHEETVPLEELYAACRTARGLLTGEHAVGRVIARPFEGEPGAYGARPTATTSRSSRRARTTSRASARPAAGRRASARSATSSPAATSTSRSRRARTPTGSRSTIALARRTARPGLVFVNLVETDMTYGHRNDPEGFHRCLQEIDAAIPDLRAALGPDDLLMLTSDHGCDPTTPSTDHSREYALLVAHVPGRARRAGATTASSPTSARPRRRGSARATGDGLPGAPIAL